MPYTGDKYCDNCFDKRKNEASDYNIEDIFDKNWGLYFVPFVGLGLLAGRGVKSIIYPEGLIYHVYADGRHEKWSKNKKDSYNKQKCNNCSNFVESYYQLENYD